LRGAPPAGSSDAPTTRASTRLAMKPIERALAGPQGPGVLSIRHDSSHSIHATPQR
jgi:hypothetical protein